MEFVHYILEDATGDVLNTVYTDVEKRMVLTVCPINSHRTTVLIVNGHQIIRRGDSELPKWELMMSFPRAGSLGEIYFSGNRDAISMEDYLRRINASSSLNRYFVAGDGLQYRWYYRRSSDELWTCYDSQGTPVAHYNAPVEQYSGTSGFSFTVVPALQRLAPELLMSLTIMRYIQQHEL